MPKVSFLMAVHNGAAFLEQTLDSLLSQDFNDYDILIVDDGSTDQSREIIDCIASSKIKVIEQENQGLVAALNAGLSVIDSDYIARIDADDICAPERLTQQLDYMAFTKAHVISARAMHIDEVGNPIGLSGISNVYDPDPNWLPAKEPYLSHPFLFGKNQVLTQFGYRHAHLSEDADLCWRLSDKHRLAIQNHVLGQYRLHTNSISSQSTRNGRVQAFYAALAALNTQRRRTGQNEIPYVDSLTGSIASAGNMAGLLEFYRSDLSDVEAAQLLAGASMKLLHLARWRGYPLTNADLAETRSAVRAVRDVNPENQIEIDLILEEASQKLAQRTLVESADRPAQDSLGQKLKSFLKK